jgi:hypothetical protein
MQVGIHFMNFTLPGGASEPARHGRRHGGEKKTLRLVTQYADACNLFASSPEEIRHKLDVLRGHCGADAARPGPVRHRPRGEGDPPTEPDRVTARFLGRAYCAS